MTKPLEHQVAFFNVTIQGITSIFKQNYNVMKRIISILMLAVIIIACGTKRNNVDQLEKTVRAAQQIKKEIVIPKSGAVQLATDVSYLASDDLKGRDTGSKGIAKAATYIQNRFIDLDIAPYQGDYMDNFKVRDTDAFNVVGMIPGTDGELKNEIVVIGAHYDHIGIMKAVAGDSIANGANDNATGTAAVLAIAESLKKLDFNRRTVVFALFSAEEKGLLGSKHLAKRMKDNGDNVVAMINFEMIGTPLVNRPYLAYLTGHDGSNMAQVFNKANDQLTVTGKLDEAAQFGLFKRSDNYPFFTEFKVPSQTFCTFDFTNFDHYHKVGDEMSEVNSQHMAQVIDALMPGVLEVVNGEQLKLVSNE